MSDVGSISEGGSSAPVAPVGTPEKQRASFARSPDSISSLFNAASHARRSDWPWCSDSSRSCSFRARTRTSR